VLDLDLDLDLVGVRFVPRPTPWPRGI